MERISDEQLFYLRSRGLAKKDALYMMLEAKIHALFSCLSMYDGELFEQEKKNILAKIIQE